LTDGERVLVVGERLGAIAASQQHLGDLLQVC
jgi:hypothetical protein